MESWIIDLLPYGEKFRFVDKILEVDDSSITGEYTFHGDHEFFQHHFIENPIVPGVILTECAAQISLACLGVFLLGKEYDFSNFAFGMTSSKVDFYIPVLPGDKVTVVAEKQVFRFGKLKCAFKMFNAVDKLLCRGELAGMMK